MVLHGGATDALHLQNADIGNRLNAVAVFLDRLRLGVGDADQLVGRIVEESRGMHLIADRALRAEGKRECNLVA